ncbi:MAG: hypothetical protein JJ885_05535 [Muricauda sp.]|jgi:hypothetical protein|nr:hypothetical protein [Allomuricauda sp.]MBO6533157.1 hypothetical protein [Allomuricauda sp.]MBO6587591.1 hypothetical protein [Allomuricauda sp.]MBO6617216.1 hypothetical protein [Allomuricauda sp.]MBO6643773.1 hypothetical protein [Allomuricauda sp.]MBO6745551.1 hypothetical protein [Allomuricauda sp.]
MKNWFKQISILLFSGAALCISSCDEGDTVVDQVTAGTERGAILRTITVISNELPVGDESGNFAVELEVQDSEDGELVNQVEVYVGFRDNTEEIGPGTNVEETLFATISSTTFTNGPFGLPRFTYSATLPDMLAHVNRTNDDITGGDQFTIRFELVLTDGRRFSFANNTGTLTGSFLRSPFLYTPLVICPVPEDYFVGEYSITQNSGSAPFGIEDAFSQPSVFVEANGVSRTIEFIYDPGGFGASFAFTFDLVCGEIQNFSGSITEGGLGCAGGGDIGQTAMSNFEYDLTDDSEFTIVFEDFNPDGGCGNTYEASITLTKL